MVPAVSVGLRALSFIFVIDPALYIYGSSCPNQKLFGVALTLLDSVLEYK
jgi:hypothetical protein